MEFRGLPLEEVQEIITLPAFDLRASSMPVNIDEAEIPGKVTRQLHHLVKSIAAIYNDNPFHNFDHASHGEFIYRHAGFL